MYSWHKFWGRKTWNVVGEFVQNYCPQDGVVLDPFSGSGVTALESLRLGRRVIAIDLNPIATEILRLTIDPVNLAKLEEAFQRVAAAVKEKICRLYVTNCRECGNEVIIECAVWERNEKKKLTLKEVRYKCFCGDVRENGCKPTAKDLKRIKEIDEEFEKSRLWYPKNRLYYSDGKPFKEKQQYDSLEEMFTPRNLHALSVLHKAIEKEDDKHLRDFLKIAFTSMVHLCSTMIAVSDPHPTSHHTAFSSTGWTQHSYWFAREFMEQNVWNKFSSSIMGHQGLMKAKIESNQYFRNVRFGSKPSQVLDGKADICILNASCLDVLDKLPSRSMDYIFTDPPYDASIQYGELSYLWVAWLKEDRNYLDRLSADEIVRNERQHKDFEVYHALLRRSFDGMYKALKLNRYLTLTFHNPTFQVRNATIRAGTFAGFEFEKIHHQPTAQKSGKSLLQPFGSAMGDFYLRFHKPAAGKPATQQEISEQRFEKIVVDTTVQLLAERSEPTPYTMVINHIDPVLAENGFFSSLQTGLDVRNVLKSHIGKEFKLVPEKIGGAHGKLWWFNNPPLVSRLTEIPLSERVEQTILRVLKSKGKVTFTDAWGSVSIEFPNSLTSDSVSIKEALQQYARQVSGGYWLLKPQITERISQHNEIIAVLAETGAALGFKIWVGKKEQASSVSGIIGAKKSLEGYVSADLSKVENIVDLRTAEQIDLLWVHKDKIISLFEIESTTTMTSSLVRGSNITGNVSKYLVIPEERSEQLNRKLKSPMFAERFEVDTWKILYFDSLRGNYKKLRNGTMFVESLIDKRVKPAMIREASSSYNLFDESETIQIVGEEIS